MGAQLNAEGRREKIPRHLDGSLEKLWPAQADHYYKSQKLQSSQELPASRELTLAPGFVQPAQNREGYGPHSFENGRVITHDTAQKCHANQHFHPERKSQQLQLRMQP